MITICRKILFETGSKVAGYSPGNLGKVRENFWGEKVGEIHTELSMSGNYQGKMKLLCKYFYDAN